MALSLWPKLDSWRPSLYALLYTLLPDRDRLEDIRERWSSNKPDFVNQKGISGWQMRTVHGSWPVVPERVKEIVISPTPTLNPGEDDELTTTAFNIVQELTTPSSNLIGSILIACSKGDISTVESLSTLAEASGQPLPLQSMLTTALLFSHLPIAKFSLQKGARIDSNVNAAAWTAMSHETLALLLPHDIFAWRSHPDYLDRLLFDCFKGYHGQAYKSQPAAEALASFLIAQGAKLRRESVSAALAKYPDIAPFILSHVSDAQGRDGVLISAIAAALEAGNIPLATLLLSRSRGATLDPLFWKNLRCVECLSLLHAHGARVSKTDARILHHAVYNGNLDVVIWLLDHDVPINTLDTNGYLGVYSRDDLPGLPNYGYALHYAVRMLRPDIVRVLLERGAEPGLKGKEGKTAWEVPLVGWYVGGEIVMTGASEVRRLLDLVRGVPKENIPRIMRRDREEREREAMEKEVRGKEEKEEKEEKVQKEAKEREEL
ncbi:ankyrin [Lepidopterella palustris CBS 459.81]|uniref:Ankyrin n=1 Tax=Lepidopterella palustris CBS 459.81 TaxID=1314670 RepID=A0A8E2E265_9PEZI|nr:ankyrin [Lepidopterella palustris CBS 459.81]